MNRRPTFRPRDYADLMADAAGEGYGPDERRSFAGSAQRIPKPEDKPKETKKEL